ncbi:MAG: SAM-dependent methlyltransferase [Myxococcaceae bacterium]|nr:SAM-dependent methlyltransferase [Myxococcaceae bacterium]
MRGVEQIPVVYDGLMAVFELFGLERWRQWLVKGARGRTLDIGCGTGRNLPLYSPDCQVVGVDPSADNLAAARRRAPSVPLVRATAHALPFRPQTFDTVVSGLVFCSVPDARRGLAEVKRVLAPGGRLRMLEHVRSTSRLGGRWQDLIQPLWTTVAGGCHPNRDTEAAVESAGFQIEPEGRRAENNLRRFSAKPNGP